MTLQVLVFFAGSILVQGNMISLPESQSSLRGGASNGLSKIDVAGLTDSLIIGGSGGDRNLQDCYVCPPRRQMQMGKSVATCLLKMVGQCCHVSIWTLNQRLFVTAILSGSWSA